MLRTFDVAALAATQGGEYVLGMKDLHTHACYLIYGIMQPGEGQRLVKPGDGHEEILCAVDGDLEIQSEKGEFMLHRGHAMHVKEDQSFFLANPSDKPVVYIMAGGHCRPHHH
jgi:uncharacterized cupin superfamily protein